MGLRGELQGGLGKSCPGRGENECRPQREKGLHLFLRVCRGDEALRRIQEGTHACVKKGRTEEAGRSSKEVEDTGRY